MAEKVIQFERKPVVHEDCITMLRHLLEKAERGEITAVMAIVEYGEEAIDVQYTETADLLVLLGMSNRMTHVINRRMNEVAF